MSKLQIQSERACAVATISVCTYTYTGYMYTRWNRVSLTLLGQLSPAAR